MVHDAFTCLAFLLLVLTVCHSLEILLPAKSPSALEKIASAKAPRPLRPRTPDDCPTCREEAKQSSRPATSTPPVRPWCQVKSQRGHPKRIKTEGYACPILHCKYHGITDSKVHALVGYGHHGQAEPIQDLFCQACHHKFSVRRGTPLYRLKTSAARVAVVLTALAEGLSVSGAMHVFGHGEATITAWLKRAGTQGERLHGQLFQNLHLIQLQLDEVHATLRNKGQEVWVWIAFDAKTKLIGAVQCGPRTQALAHALIHALIQVLAPDFVPLFVSDGLDLYGYALTAHFGQWVQPAGQPKRQWQVKAELLYGQLKKTYRRRKLVKVERRVRWGTWEGFKAKLREQGLGHVLNTAFVERVNLTLRRGIAALQRRSWSTTQTLHQLEVHLQWWKAYYHFVRPHGSLRERLAVPWARRGNRLPQQYQKRTPAMAAGVTDHRWTVVELLSFPLPV